MSKLVDHILKVEKDIFDWLNRERYWIAYLLFLCFISFAYELFNFTLTVDEEFYAERSGSSFFVEWVRQGRWTMFLLSYLFPVNPIIPFAPLFFTLVCSALSFSLIVRLFSSERSIKDYIAAPLFMACPTLYYVYSFNTLNFGIGIGFLSGALAIYLFQFREGLLKWGVPTLLIAIAIGIYQAFLPWIFVLLCFSLLKNIFKTKVELKEVCRSFISALVLLFAGLVLYYLISKGFRIALNISSNEYIDGFVKYKINLDYVLQTAKQIVYSMKNYYLGKDDIYDQSLTSLLVLFLVTLFSILYQIIRSNQTLATKLFGLLIVLFILLSPFTLNVISAGVMPTRALLAIPLVFSGLVFLSLSSSSKLVRLVVMLAAFATTFQFITINNRFAFADHMSWQADRALTLRILTRLDALYASEGSVVDSKRPYALVGNISRSKYPVIVQRETIGASFYAWDQGNVHRVMSLMRSMGFDEYDPASLEEQRSVMQFADMMPVWPHTGAVAIKNGITIVKLGNYTHSQLVPLCSGEFSSPICRMQYNPGNGGIHILEPNKDLDQEKLIFNLSENRDQTEILNATSTEKNGEITLDVPGNPAQIILPEFDLSEDETVLLRIDIEAPGETNLFLFYRYPGNTEYEGENQMQIKLYAGMNELLFSVPARLLKQSLRIDPGFEPGIYKIKHLEMYKQNENPL